MWTMYLYPVYKKNGCCECKMIILNKPKTYDWALKIKIDLWGQYLNNKLFLFVSARHTFF